MNGIINGRLFSNRVLMSRHVYFFLYRNLVCCFRPQILNFHFWLNYLLVPVLSRLGRTWLSKLLVRSAFAIELVNCCSSMTTTVVELLNINLTLRIIHNTSSRWASLFLFPRTEPSREIYIFLCVCYVQLNFFLVTLVRKLYNNLLFLSFD